MEYTGHVAQVGRPCQVEPSAVEENSCRVVLVVAGVGELVHQMKQLEYLVLQCTCRYFHWTMGTDGGY